MGPGERRDADIAMGRRRLGDRILTPASEDSHGPNMRSVHTAAHRLNRLRKLCFVSGHDFSRAVND